jgi:X-Pro dipeptidyl-peptidase
VYARREQFLCHAADNQAPTLNLPPAKIYSRSTTVNYQANATDMYPPSPAVTCSPPPGTFPVDTATTVTCTAADAAGNAATGSFEVLVGE